MRAWISVCVGAALCAAAEGYAQQPGEIRFVLYQPPTSAEPTLPEVVVTPEAPAEPASPPLPPFEGGAGASRAGLGAGGGGVAFPSLSGQSFGGLNSLMPGGESIFGTPQFGSITTHQELRERQSLDMVRALQTEAGVMVQTTARGQASPFLRGVTGQEIVVLIDGIRMNNSVLRAGPNQYFNTVDPGLVDRIEVIRGASSVVWGSDAIGGAINIVTRSADPLRANYGGPGAIQYFSSSDMASYSRVTTEAWVGSTGVYGGASYMNVNDLDRGGNFGRQPFTNYDQNAGDVKFNLLVDDDQLLTFAVQHFQQDSVPRSDRFRPFVNQYNPSAAERPTFFDPQQRELAYVRMQGTSLSTLFDNYSATVSYQRTKEGLIEDNLTTNPQRRDIGEFDVNTFGSTLLFSRDLGLLGNVAYGADYYYDDIDAFKNRFNRNTGAFISPQIPQYPDDSIYDRAGGFLQWDVDITERLTLLPGTRYENINVSGTPTVTINGVNTNVPLDRTYQAWIGSCGAVYELTPNLNLVGGYYEGFRGPNVDDLVSTKTFAQQGQQFPVIGTFNVQPEFANTYECGFKLDTPRFRGQMIEYWVDFQDYITRTVDASNNAILSNVDARINGTELAGEYLFEGNWSLWGNFWYTFGQNLTQAEPFNRIPPTQGYLGMRRRAPELSGYLDIFVWMVRRQDRLTSLNAGDARFPPDGQPGYATLNARAGRFLDEAGHHRVTLGAENLTDKYYRVFGSGVDGPGINFLLGYEWVR
ncbi:MAG: TonB-dependent receptor [Pirellulales bacterium]|nr:TonB-dependent receptor [Pirellulales bacterium]